MFHFLLYPNWNSRICGVIKHCYKSEAKMKAKKFERSSHIRKFRFILLQVRLCRKTFNSTGIESNKGKTFSREKIVWHVRTCRHQKISHATKIKTQKSRREKEREKTHGTSQCFLVDVCRGKMIMCLWFSGPTRDVFTCIHCGVYLRPAPSGVQIMCPPVASK